MTCEPAGFAFKSSLKNRVANWVPPRLYVCKGDCRVRYVGPHPTFPPLLTKSSMTRSLSLRSLAGSTTDLHRRLLDHRRQMPHWTDSEAEYVSNMKQAEDLLLHEFPFTCNKIRRSGADTMPGFVYKLLDCNPEAAFEHQHPYNPSRQTFGPWGRCEPSTAQLEQACRRFNPLSLVQDSDICEH